MQKSGDKIENIEDRIWKNVVSDGKNFTIDLMSQIFGKVDGEKMKTLMAEVKNYNLDNPRLFGILDSLIHAKFQDQEKSSARQEILEIILSKIRIEMAEEEVSNYQLALKMLNLEKSVLESEKPIISKECEAECLITSLSIDWRKIEDFETFIQIWNSVYSILSISFQRRSNSVILPRIPSAMLIFRRLLKSLISQSSKNANFRKDFESCAHLLDRIAEQIRTKHKEDFARVAPFLISDFMASFCNNKIPINVKNNLDFAVNKLLDICDKHSKEYLSATLPDGQREVFKETLNNYQKYHKYTGHV